VEQGIAVMNVRARVGIMSITFSPSHAARICIQRHAARTMAKFGIFRDTELATDCDECGGRVDLLKGGACVRCRRILCFMHLHGSFVRRLATDLGAETLCVRCRTRGGRESSDDS
jgi:hypothetical protein